MQTLNGHGLWSVEKEYNYGKEFIDRRVTGKSKDH